MPTGVTSLQKTLIGVEASAGGSTDFPTTHWRGIGKILDRRETVFPPERVGKIGGTSRSYVPRTGGEVSLTGDANFEQLAYIFNAGIYAATATTDTGSGYIRQWDLQYNSTDPLSTTDLNTLVVESGDNIDVEIARYVFIREYSLAGGQMEGLQINATGESRAPSTFSAFTAVGDTDFENPCETVVFSNVGLYIDDSTGTIGTTQKSETVLDMTFNHKTGWVAIPARDGRLDFSSIKHVDDEIMLEFTFEHNSVATAEKAAWRAQTERALRLQWTGSALSSAGVYSTKLLRLDLYGKWQSFGAEGLEEEDGDNVYKGTFRVSYCAAAQKKGTILLVNEVATLP